MSTVLFYRTQPAPESQRGEQFIASVSARYGGNVADGVV